MRKSSSHVSVRKGKGAICAVVAVLVAFVAALGITTTAQAALSDHTVPGVSPRGTTINVFDYWITGQDDPDNVTQSLLNDRGQLNTLYTQGINGNNHVLKFGAGMGTQSGGSINSNSVNYWTGSSAPRRGIVSNQLGADGYPVLSGTGNIGTSSLGYLFDSSEVAGKAAYMDVDGLLQVDDQGYYYYNSQRNFAQFNEGSNSFTLYNRWGVRAGGASPNGQFFPFNSGSEVFTERGGQLQEHTVRNGREWATIDGERVQGTYNRDGSFTPNAIISTDEDINHYFGLNMSTRFVQQNDGHTAEAGVQGRQEVTYNFSGDDDVWIYIDGVLVGDLGGIHDKTSIEINFADGHVYVYDDANNDNMWTRGETLYQNTTLRALFEAVGKENAVTWRGNTFANDTYHTLDFFYLERGNTDSNMSLKYNLVNIPESGVVKVDQYGDALRGVQFTLREANDDYSLVNGGMTVSGTTNNSGEFIFTHEVNGQDMPITLEQLNLESPYWVLTEDNVPEGYRSGGEMHLRFEDGFLLSSNEWDTGAWAEPHVTAVAPTQVVGTNGQTYDPANGIVFAVVFQFDESGNLHPVSGDDERGWNVAEGTGKSGIIAAAKANNYQFLLGSGGGYETTIENLPGDILTYEYVVSSNPGSTTEAKYAVRYYYAQGVDSVYSLNDSSDIIELDPNARNNDFDRIFSVTLNVPNIKNELTLVKTDATSSTTKLEGAEFALYNAADFVDVDNHGQAIGTFTTDKNGSFNVTTSGDLLVKGEYVLVETEAPSGYELEQTPISIVVDDEGVHVDAGTASDNVSVETGIGDLVYSMKSFAAGDDVDSTLHDVKAQAQTADSYNGTSTKWDNASAAVTHYQYDDTTDGLGYVRNNSVPDNGDATFIAEAGWSRLDLRQCREHQGEDPIENKENLGDQSLNALFTGDVTIHVTNDPVGSLKISKTVENAPSSASDAEFTFELVVEKDGTAVTGEFDATFTDAAGNTTQSKITLVDPATETGNEIALKGGESVLIAGLPYGATYEVTEEPVDNYVSSSTGSTGTISNNTAAEAAFTNTYEESLTIEAAKALSVVKNLENHSLADDQFHFVIKAVDTKGGATAAEAAAKLGLADGKTTVEFSNDAAAMANGVATDSMNPLQNGLTFTTADRGKTFTYEVSEVVPEDVPAGYVYDSNDTHTVTYTVSGGTTTNLSVGSSVDENEVASGVPTVTFTNSYEPGVTTDSDAGTAIDVQKTVTGRETTADFAFKLTLTSGDADAVFEGSGDSKTAFDGMGLTIGEDFAAGDTKTASFGEITFTAEGTYVFSVEETTPTPSPANGWTYDNATARTVTVTVEDQNGQLAITKVAYDNASAPAVADKNVTDAAAFTNSYTTSGTTTVTADEFVGLTKVLSGKAWGENDKFTFKIDRVTEGAPLPNVTEVTVGRADVDGQNEDGNDFANFGFGPIEFNAIGKYEYTVTEVSSSNSAISVDGHTATVTITVSDNGTGGLTSSVVVTAQNGTFTNIYNPDGVTYAGVGIEKQLDGRDIVADEFSFNVKPADTASAELAGIALEGEDIPLSTGATMNSDGVATSSLVLLGNKTFSTKDAGTYKYTISEVKGTDGAITYDETTYAVEIVVEDDGNGLIKVTTYVGCSDGSGWSATATNSKTDPAPSTPVELLFKNTYTSTGELPGEGEGRIVATKTFNNGSLDEKAFTFAVSATNAADETKTYATGKTTSSGSIVFDPISYTKDGLIEDAKKGFASYTEVDGKDTYTYTYQVSENTDGLDEAGITPEVASLVAYVTVTDEGDGTLSTNVSYQQGMPNGLEFVNTYGKDAEASVYVAGTKVYDTAGTTNAPGIEGKFTFTLTGVVEGEPTVSAPLPGGATDKVEVTNSKGSVVFGTIDYDIEDAGKTYVYTVTESGSVPAVDNDVNSTRTFTVTVEDMNDGTITATCSEKPGEQFLFTNSYKLDEPVDSSVSDQLTITKTLTGRDMADGEFEFVLLDGSNQEVARGRSAAAADGEAAQVTFDPIEFDELGAYDYTLREVDGDKGGVTYDGNSYVVRATVSDKGDGTMGVEWSFVGEGVTAADFENTYEASMTTVSNIGAVKTLTGRDLKAGEFEFALTRADGSVAATAKNAADGSVEFGTLTYKAEGVYEYTISEVSGSAEGVAYDTHEYGVTVTVTDDGDGHLVASVAYDTADGSMPTFANTYVPTEEPVDPGTPGGDGGTGDGGSGNGDELVPDAGDHSGQGIGLVAVLGAAAVACGVVVRKATKRQ